MGVNMILAAALLAGVARSFTLGVTSPRGLARRSVAVRAGFGKPTKNAAGRRSFVKPGKKDLEAQWERYFGGSLDGATEASVWSRAPGVEWLLVGAVNAVDARPEDAFALQKSLIAWTAVGQHLPLQAKEKQLEFGLGPGLDDDFLKDYDPVTTPPVDGIASLSKVKAPDTLRPKDVGFKPFKSPLKEHQASIGSTFLNRSTGKGSVKFKRAGTAAAGGDAQAEEEEEQLQAAPAAAATS